MLFVLCVVLLFLIVFCDCGVVQAFITRSHAVQ